MSKTLNAGYQLRQLRIAKQMTQQEVVDRSGGAISLSTVSRLETGALAKPSLHEVIAYAKVLGLTPNEVARMYGLWTDGTEPRDEPQAIAQARSLASRLPDGPIKEELLSWIRFAVAHALAESARAM